MVSVVVPSVSSRVRRCCVHLLRVLWPFVDGAARMQRVPDSPPGHAPTHGTGPRDAIDSDMADGSAKAAHGVGTPKMAGGLELEEHGGEEDGGVTGGEEVRGGPGEDGESEVTAAAAFGSGAGANEDGQAADAAARTDALAAGGKEATERAGLQVLTLTGSMHELGACGLTCGFAEERKPSSAQASDGGGRSGGGFNHGLHSTRTHTCNASAAHGPRSPQRCGF